MLGHSSYPTAFWDSLAPGHKAAGEVLPIDSILNTNDCTARKALLSFAFKIPHRPALPDFHSNVFEKLRH